MKRKPPDKTKPAKSGFGRSSFGRKPAGESGPQKGAAQKGGLKSALADRREAVKRAAINALKRAKRAAEKTGVELSDWEDEFLGSVQERVNTYGRAFGDPEKGGQGEALSLMQVVKLKEITAKAKGEKRAFPSRRGRARKTDAP